MEIKDHVQTVRTTDVIHVYDAEKNINWFIAFEKINGAWDRNPAREMMNYEFFKKQGAEYMQKVYDAAYKHINKS